MVLKFVILLNLPDTFKLQPANSCSGPNAGLVFRKRCLQKCVKAFLECFRFSFTIPLLRASVYKIVPLGDWAAERGGNAMHACCGKTLAYAGAQHESKSGGVGNWLCSRCYKSCCCRCGHVTVEFIEVGAHHIDIAVGGSIYARC